MDKLRLLIEMIVCQQDIDLGRRGWSHAVAYDSASKTKTKLLEINQHWSKKSRAINAKKKNLPNDSIFKKSFD